MRNLQNVLVLLSLSLFLIQTALANNVAVSNIGLTEQNIAEKFVLVEFDLTWDNSWRDSTNRDAVWVFVKYSLDEGGTWMHASLDTAGHKEPTGASVDAPDDGRGVFIYRNDNGAGPVNFTGVQLRWNYGTDGVADDAVVRVKVFAIEMVLVPEAAFAAGSGGTGFSEFTLTTIDTADATVAPSGTGSLGGEAGGFPTGQSAPDNASWPNGFSAFYCMKYEISQEQYADFLNTLTSAQAATRNPQSAVNASFGRYSITGSHANFSASKQFVACSYLSWMDGAAYADWAGLRPMTELEYEKASRGDQTAVPNEFAWGNTNITAATSISNDDDENEVPNNAGANCVFGFQGGVQGPMRTGCFATGSSTREQAGASFYGIMELSGNLWERSVTIGNTEGRTFTGTVGDGSLSQNGNATNDDWPGFAGGEVTGATGSGSRGGSWGFNRDAAFVSDRVIATAVVTNRNENNGFRCVRSAP